MRKFFSLNRLVLDYVCNFMTFFWEGGELKKPQNLSNFLAKLKNFRNKNPKKSPTFEEITM